MTDPPISIIRDNGDDTTVDIDNPGDEVDDDGDVNVDDDYDDEVDEDDDGDDVEKLSKQQQQQSQPSVGRRWIDNSENFLNIGCHHPRCLSLLSVVFIFVDIIIIVNFMVFLDQECHCRCYGCLLQQHHGCHYDDDDDDDVDGGEDKRCQVGQ